ncbi:MAG TPA: hypothetical protein VKV57_10945 [bacterium]|nr:hypothetical protein [bacterium]
MANWAAVIRVLALAVWIGGMVSLDFIEAPLRFGSGVITRNQAVALGQLVITRWVWAEWIIGAIVVIASLVAAAPRWAVGLVALMLAIVTVQGAFLAPAITRLAQGLDFVNRTVDPRYASIRQLHAAYAALELIVLVGGMVLLAGQAWPGKR